MLHLMFHHLKLAMRVVPAPSRSTPLYQALPEPMLKL